MRTRKAHILCLLLFILSSTALASSASDQIKKEDVRYEHLKMFSDALFLIEKFYVKEVVLEKLIQSAIQGMTKSLDPYSYFLNATQIRNFKKKIKGTFYGIGIEVAIHNKTPIIISVFDNSPARKAGLQVGDRIVKINGRRIEEGNMQDVSEQFDLKKRRTHSITVVEPQSNRLKTVKLQSSKVRVQSVSYKDLENHLLYIHIHSFMERTYEEFKKIIDSHQEIEGLVLDLRQNPGGLLDSAIRLADLFVSQGILVRIKGREKETITRAHSPHTRTGFPIVILIDSYSASATEVLTAALQDNRRAIVMGRKSFGKASVQTLLDVGKEHAIKLTVAYYYTPSGKTIHGKGVVPDVDLKKPIPKTSDKYVVLGGEEDTDFQQATSFLKMLKVAKNKKLSAF